MNKEIYKTSQFDNSALSASFSSVSSICHSLKKKSTLKKTHTSNMQREMEKQSWAPDLPWSLPSCYDFPFTVGPNVFFLGAMGGWALDFSVATAFLALGCRELRPRISQNLLHWCKTLNWSIKEVAQFPLKPLYLKKRLIVNASF